MKRLCVIVDYPDNCPYNEAREYVKDALGSWGGQFFPGDEYNEPDPLFEGMSVRSIKPVRIKK